MSYIFGPQPGLHSVSLAETAVSRDAKEKSFHSGGEAMATFLKRAVQSSAGEAASRALQEAGLGMVEIRDWSDAAGQFDGAAAVVCAEEDEAKQIATALAPGRPALSREAARSLSHDLRTPLSAMAGWVHLLETGKLDEAGMKRVVGKLRGNIDDQVRTIEKYLGTTQKGMAER